MGNMTLKQLWLQTNQNSTYFINERLKQISIRFGTIIIKTLASCPISRSCLTGMTAAKTSAKHKFGKGLTHTFIKIVPGGVFKGEFRTPSLRFIKYSFLLNS